VVEVRFIEDVVLEDGEVVLDVFPLIVVDVELHIVEEVVKPVELVVLVGPPSTTISPF